MVHYDVFSWGKTRLRAIMNATGSIKDIFDYGHVELLLP